MNQLPVEVCGGNGAFYQARIKFISEFLLTVVYENNPKLEFSVSCDSVRPPPPPNFSSELCEGDTVEVYSRVSEEEPFGWWLAQIKMITGEGCLIEYVAGGEEYVSHKSIRPCNPNRFYLAETQAYNCQLDEEKVSLQVKNQYLVEAQNEKLVQTEEQPCKTAFGETSQPTAGPAFQMQPKVKEQHRVEVQTEEQPRQTVVGENISKPTGGTAGHMQVKNQCCVEAQNEKQPCKTVVGDKTNKPTGGAAYQMQPTEKEQHRVEVRTEEQPSQAVVEEKPSQPIRWADVVKKMVKVSESSCMSPTPKKPKSMKTQPSAPVQQAETNDFTEELWEYDDGRPAWTLKIEPPPPKLSKGARRKLNRTKGRPEYTMEDDYDAEEFRDMPDGIRLYRRFSGLWVQMP